MKQMVAGLAMFAAVAAWSEDSNANVTFDFSNGDCLGDSACLALADGVDVNTAPSFSFTSGGLTTTVTGVSTFYGGVDAPYYQRDKADGENGLGVAYVGYAGSGGDSVNLNLGDTLTFSFPFSVAITGLEILNQDEDLFNGDIQVNGSVFSVVAGIVQGLPSAMASAFNFENVGSSDDSSAYFVSKITVTSIPAALPLLLSGIAGLAYLRKRRQKATA
jgi:hypothetical protein